MAVAAVVVLLSGALGLYVVYRAPDIPPLAFSEFLKAVDAGQVTAVTLSERTIDVTLRDGQKARTIAPAEFLSSSSAFVTDLYRRSIRVEVMPGPEPGSLSWG